MKVQGNNYNKYLTINQNLLIANIKAIVEYELRAVVILTTDGRELMNETLIRDVLKNNDIIEIEDGLETNIIDGY